MLRLVDHEGVVVEVVGDDELPVDVFRLVSVHDSVEPQLDLVVHPLEVILLWRLRDQSEAVSEGVLLISEVVVRRDLEF